MMTTDTNTTIDSAPLIEGDEDHDAANDDHYGLLNNEQHQPSQILATIMRQLVPSLATQRYTYLNSHTYSQ